MIIEKFDDPPTLKTYRIHHRGGAVDYVQAASYSYQPQTDEIRFFDRSNNEVAIFTQVSSGIRSISDLDYIPEAPLIAELKQRIEALEEMLKKVLEKISPVILAFSFDFFFF